MRQSLTPQEQSLIADLRNYLATPARQSIGRPPLTPTEFDAAIHSLGFPVPPLFRALYLQIGNGGFGPGQGLFKLVGGDQDSAAVLPAYRMLTGPDLPPEYGSWHPYHLMLVDWGCAIYSAIDCTTGDGAIYRYNLDRFGDGESGPVRDFGILESDTLRDWLNNWMQGIDQFSLLS